MEATAKLTSKGQLTIPKRVRDALELRAGEEVVFRVERTRAAMAKTPGFLDPGRSVDVPAGKRGMSWNEVLRRSRRSRRGRIGRIGADR